MSQNSGAGKLVRIGQAAEAAGVSKQSVQYYLMVGLLEPTGHSPGGQQLFDGKAIERVRLIKKLNESGYPLREIREIFLRREQGEQGDRQARSDGDEG